jgi:hypothetical protein
MWPLEVHRLERKGILAGEGATAGHKQGVECCTTGDLPSDPNTLRREQSHQQAFQSRPLHTVDARASTSLLVVFENLFEERKTILGDLHVLIDAAFMRPGHIVFGDSYEALANVLKSGYPELWMSQRDRGNRQRERNISRRDRKGDSTRRNGLCYAFSGVVLRRTGSPWDIWNVQGCDPHDQVEFDVLVGKNGDCCESSLIVCLDIADPPRRRSIPLAIQEFRELLRSDRCSGNKSHKGNYNIVPTRTLPRLEQTGTESLEALITTSSSPPRRPVLLSSKFIPRSSRPTSCCAHEGCSARDGMHWIGALG